MLDYPVIQSMIVYVISTTFQNMEHLFYCVLTRMIISSTTSSRDIVTFDIRQIKSIENFFKKSLIIVKVGNSGLACSETLYAFLTEQMNCNPGSPYKKCLLQRVLPSRKVCLIIFDTLCINVS